MGITPDQCRMARGALNINLKELAALSGLSHVTINRFEKRHTYSEETAITLKTAFEKAGIIFIEADSEAGPGLRLRK